MKPRTTRLARQPTDVAGAAQLYTTDILGLAVALADYPLGEEEWRQRGEARSPVCGSTIELGLNTGRAGVIEHIGLKVQACAIGQAAAAIFAKGARGRSYAEIVAAHDAIADWLAGEGDLPDWPDFAHLAPAQPYPGRHGAIILPWKAARDALSPDKRAG